MNNIENLITPKRFDLMSKYLYIKYGYLKKINFFINLYIQHIKTFNNFWEYPGTKQTKEDFISSFNNLIEKIKNNGFDSKYPIEVGNNNILINGSHRLIICYFYNVNFVINKKKQNGCETYNYDFFINRNNYWKKNNDIYNNLSIKYCDTMVLEYIKHKKNIRTMTIYPIIYETAIIKESEIENLINNYGYIYYKKIINLNKNGVENLIKEMYRGEKWIGGLFPNNTGKKINYCYKNNNPIIIYFIEFNNNDNNEIIKFKNNCRNFFNIDKHSLHIPDTQNDTYRIASTILNENSLHILNKLNTNIIHSEQKKIYKNFFTYINLKYNNYIFSKDNIIILNDIFNNKLKNDKLINNSIYNNKLKILKYEETPNSDFFINYSIYNESYNDENILNLFFTPNYHYYFNGFKFIY